MPRLRPMANASATAVRATAATAIARAVRTAINRVRRSAPTARSGQDFKRPDRERPDRPPRGDRPPRRDRDRDRDDNRPGRTWSSDNDRRGKEADPNSPFAKLLALKEQLEANKER